MGFHYLQKLMILNDHERSKRITITGNSDKK